MPTSITATLRTCLPSRRRVDLQPKQHQKMVLVTTHAPHSSTRVTAAGDRRSFDVHHRLAQPQPSSASPFTAPVRQARLLPSRNSLHEAIMSPLPASQRGGATLGKYSSTVLSYAKSKGAACALGAQDVSWALGVGALGGRQAARNPASELPIAAAVHALGILARGPSAAPHGLFASANFAAICAADTAAS